MRERAFATPRGVTLATSHAPFSLSVSSCAAVKGAVGHQGAVVLGEGLREGHAVAPAVEQARAFTDGGGASGGDDPEELDALQVAERGLAHGDELAVDGGDLARGDRVGDEVDGEGGGEAEGGEFHSRATSMAPTRPARASRKGSSAASPRVTLCRATFTSPRKERGLVLGDGLGDRPEVRERDARVVGGEGDGDGGDAGGAVLHGGGSFPEGTSPLGEG
ncbi:MAG: hypothetical protein R3A52_07755 [Polyangiales bacterium]